MAVHCLLALGFLYFLQIPPDSRTLLSVKFLKELSSVCKSRSHISKRNNGRFVLCEFAWLMTINVGVKVSFIYVFGKGAEELPQYFVILLLANLSAVFDFARAFAPIFSPFSHFEKGYSHGLTMMTRGREVALNLSLSRLGSLLIFFSLNKYTTRWAIYLFDLIEEGKLYLKDLIVHFLLQGALLAIFYIGWQNLKVSLSLGVVQLACFAVSQLEGLFYFRLFKERPVQLWKLGFSSRKLAF